MRKISKEEKKFFDFFQLGEPYMKTVRWNQGWDAHCDDWYYSSESFKDLGIKLSIKEVNKRIEEAKKEKPEDIKHGGFCFSGGCFVEAYLFHPVITKERLIKLLCVLSQTGKQLPPVKNEKELIKACTLLLTGDRKYEKEIKKIFKEEY